MWNLSRIIHQFCLFKKNKIYTCAWNLKCLKHVKDFLCKISNPLPRKKIYPSFSFCFTSSNGRCTSTFVHFLSVNQLRALRTMIASARRSHIHFIWLVIRCDCLDRLPAGRFARNTNNALLARGRRSSKDFCMRVVCANLLLNFESFRIFFEFLWPVIYTHSVNLYSIEPAIMRQSATNHLVVCCNSWIVVIVGCNIRICGSNEHPIVDCALVYAYILDLSGTRETHRLCLCTKMLPLTWVSHSKCDIL